MFDAVDTDGSGMIEYSEFVVATLGEDVLLSNDKLIMTFKMFDKDGGGTISVDELKEVLAFGEDVTEETMEEILKLVDDNEDKIISYNEFKIMLGLKVEEEKFTNVLQALLGSDDSNGEE